MNAELYIPNISQSALGLYRDCPHAYYLKYKMSCQPIFWNFDVLDTGSYVHDAIDMYYKHNYLTEAESYEDILYYSYKNFKEIWDITLSNEEFLKGYTSLENHAKWEYSNLQNNIVTKPLTELKIKLDGLYAIIDYADLNRDMLVDWKTNKYAGLSYNYRMQAEIYKRSYERKFNKELEHFYFFFLYPNEWRTVKFGNKKQDEVSKEVDALLDAVHKSWINNEFPKQPRTDRGCDGCLFRYYCKMEEST